MNNQTILITGAANGLGRALVVQFHRVGWQVIATDMDPVALDTLPSNPSILTQVMDVTSDESVTRVSEWMSQEAITLDLIINNAGIDRYFPFSEAPVARMKEVFEVNLFGSYRVNQTFLPFLRKPGGRILHIGSESLNLTIPFMAYPISKNALERYAKVLRIELQTSGIDVIVVRPGAIQTSLLAKLSTITPVARDAKLSARFSKFASTAPKNVGRVLTPDQVARFIYNVSLVNKPQAVYKINNSFQLKVAALMPFWLTERIVRRMLE
jgi:NAD(P)-dependent dehydrogenase (short-subunit alcohol dehydrogenase family)